MAMEDQIEEYIIVYDNDDGLLPDISSSHKRKKSLTIPAGFHLDLKIQENDEVNNFVKSNNSLSQESLSKIEPTQKQLCSSINFANTDITHQSSSNHNRAAENIIQPLANSSYVDIQIHDNIREVGVKQMDYSRVKEVKGDNILIVEREDVPGYMDVQRQDENIPEDYSRVKEVHSDNIVVLQKQHISADSSFREMGNHYTDCTSEKLRNTHATTPSKVTYSLEYVETVPAPPFMYSEIV